ncbi:MAG: DUF4159 domain-containing protein [Ignavibacteriales bacterium]|nr:DUF4159 domain-containing protein [Ignavibacteriales bacterium]
MTKKILLILALIANVLYPQDKSAFQIARLKYDGGGDWYNDPSEEINLLKYISENTNIKVKADYVFVDVKSDDIFSYPFLFLTGHGNIVLSDAEAARLRSYLENGGFLYVDDDYGLDKVFRREIKKVFPDKELLELPYNYGLFNCFYNFPNGVPKTHEHEGKPPQSFGIFLDKRLAVLYTYESNPSDGWNDPEVHNDPPQKREEALKFGTNIVVWALSQQQNF